MAKKILVTAALPYLNNLPHMGHMVGSHLPADIYARYHRSKGNDVVFVGGSDEHGTPNIMSADKYRLSPKEFCDIMHGYHKGIYEKFGISYDNFTRTSNPVHHQTTQEFFKTLDSKRLIKEKETDQYFCSGQKMFLPDRYVEGKCPRCGAEANGDQCENCSTHIDNNLILPHCSDCGNPAELRKTRNLFIDLPKISKRLEEWVGKQDSWRPHVKKEAERWLREGLQDRAITRDLSWGVKIPKEGNEDKVFYVWFDAPIGYISAVKELGREDEFWHNPDADIVQFMGKDNIPFHTIFFPAMLLGNGDYRMPTNIVGLNYLLMKGGEKFSKSKQKGVFCDRVIDSGIDMNVVRAYLTTMLPEETDSNFSPEGFQTFVNGELSGKFGNLFQRVLSPVKKRYGGKLNVENLGCNNRNVQMLCDIKDSVNKITEYMEIAELRQAFRGIMELSQITHKYLDDQKPWNQDADDAKATCAVALNAAKAIAIMAEPFMPEAMNRVLREQMGIHLPEQKWEYVSQIVSKFDIGNPTPLFRPITDKQIETMTLEPKSLEEILR